MKAQELRIGNFIENTDSQMASYMVVNADVIKQNEHTMYASLEPIPLTEEWLIKFGFESQYNNMTYITTFNLSDSPFSYVQGKFVVNTSTGDFCVYIDKVHSLQNLYFALTGKELTLKP